MTDKPTLPLDLRATLEAVTGGALAYTLTIHIPGVASAFVCSAAFAVLAFSSTQSIRPVFSWAGTGAVAGSVVGAATSLSALAADQGVQGLRDVRYTIIATLVAGGLAGGILRGRNTEGQQTYGPAAFLERVSALTVIAFALVVTALYPSRGLDEVRTVFSRLSTMTTIVATALAVPSWIGFLAGRRLRRMLNSRSVRRVA